MAANIVSKKKASIVNLLFNYANVIFTIINGLVLLPLYLKHFSVSTYGSFLSSGNIIGMLGLLEGGLSYVLTQKLAILFAKKDNINFSKTLASGLLIAAIVGAIILTIGIALYSFIPDWVKAEPLQGRNLQIAFLLSAAGAGLNIVFNNLSAIYQSLLKVHISGTANLISILFGVLSTLGGLYNNLGIVSIPLGVFVRGLVGVSILAIKLVQVVRQEGFFFIIPERRLCIEILKATMPMLGSAVSKSVVNNSQLLIITNFINPAASAIFFITSRLYQLCDSFLAPIGSSIFSSVSHIVGEGDVVKLRRCLFQVLMIFTAFSTLILTCSFCMNHAFVNLLIGVNKYGGNALSALLCINMFFYTRNNFLEVNLFALGVFGKTVAYDMLTSGLRLALIFLLIQRFGFLAVPIAEILSTTLILSILLNKIMVKKNNFNGLERVRFISTGWHFVVMAIPIAIYWYTKVRLPGNWFWLAAQAILLSGILSCVILITTKYFRNHVILLLSKIR